MSDLGTLDPAANGTQVRMRDGVRLWSDVYLPDSDGPFPTVLIRLPYGTARGYTYMPDVARYLAARGYAVLVQDVRGRFRSEGERTPWFNERDDAYDTLEWLVAQAWCSGSVGMIGNSYYGFTQWAAAASGHPALKAIVPRYTSQSIPPAAWFAREGIVAGPDGTVSWLTWMWTTAGDPGHEQPVDYAARPLVDAIPPRFENARRLLHERLAIDPDAFERRVFGSDGRPAPRLQVPALHVAGWWDNCKPYQLADWAEVAQSPAAEHQFLLVDATDHRDIRFGPDGPPDPDHLHGDDAALARYLPRMLETPIAFFDHYLKDGVGPAPLPRVRYRIANGPWAVADAWPPRGADRLELHLAAAERALAGASGGRLQRQPINEAAEIAWTHDPEDPVPSVSDNDFEILLALPDEVAVHARDDVATFTGPPVNEPLEIVGEVRARLTIGSSAPATSVIATLCDVSPDGRAWMIVEGAAHVQTTETIVIAEIELGATAYRLEPGHALRLAVSSSRHPRYIADPATGESPWFALETRTSDQRLLVGGQHGGTLALAVMCG